MFHVTRNSELGIWNDITFRLKSKMAASNIGVNNNRCIVKTGTKHLMFVGLVGSNKNINKCNNK